MKIRMEPKTEGFKGFVMVDMPRHLERLELLKGVNYSSSKDGEVKAGQLESGVEIAKVLAREVAKRVTELQLEYVPTGLVFEKLEDLEVYEEGVAVINEIGAVILNGLKLGKTSGPQ